MIDQVIGALRRLGSGPKRKSERRRPDSDATYIQFEDLKLHLDLMPYLEIPFPFDPEACLGEAQALLDHFVDHRNYGEDAPQAPRWRSLALRALDGDFRKTMAPHEYGAHRDAEYRETEIARRCPRTMDFLARLTDLRCADRVRFMLLEPGARIRVHRDSADGTVSLACNIALNMPEGCAFYSETNPDGSHTPFTRQIPFKPGSVMILDVGKYHYVVNESREARIHLIVHAPLRISRAELIRLAMAQNKITSTKELIHQLILKYAQQQRAIPARYIEMWKNQGIARDRIQEHFQVLVVVPSKALAPELRDECVRITRASIYPLRHELITELNFDAWAQDHRETSRTPWVILGAGTWIPDTFAFISRTISEIARMRENGCRIAGHILDRRHSSRETLPYLHEQFAIIDAPAWQESSLPRFGVPHETREAEMPEYEASPQNFHDDYTPHWLRPKEGSSCRRGQAGWATELLAASLQSGAPVLALSPEIRLTKHFSYPRKPRSLELERIRESIRDRLLRNGEQVYHFNNEPLKLLDFPGFRPEKIVAVAAGFKPLALVHQFWHGQNGGQLISVDHSARALAHFSKLCATDGTEKSILEVLSQAIPGQNSDQIRARLRDAIAEGFENDARKLSRALERARGCRTIRTDFVREPGDIVALMSPGQPFLFWHSNSWSCDSVYYSYSPEDLADRYAKLGKQMAGRMSRRVWRHRNHFELLLGRDLEHIDAVWTDGRSSNLAFDPADYTEFTEEARV